MELLAQEEHLVLSLDWLQKEHLSIIGNTEHDHKRGERFDHRVVLFTVVLQREEGRRILYDDIATTVIEVLLLQGGGYTIIALPD